LGLKNDRTIDGDNVIDIKLQTGIFLPSDVCVPFFNMPEVDRPERDPSILASSWIANRESQGD
jgi:hypothetical protein